MPSTTTKVALPTPEELTTACDDLDEAVTRVGNLAHRIRAVADLVESRGDELQL